MTSPEERYPNKSYKVSYIFVLWTVFPQSLEDRSITKRAVHKVNVK